MTTLFDSYIEDTDLDESLEDENNRISLLDLIDTLSVSLDTVTDQLHQTPSKVVTKSNEWRHKTTEAWQTQRQTLEKRRQKLQRQLDAAITQLSHKVNSDSKLVQLRDKISFLTGVGNTCVTPLVAAHFPEWFPLYYTLQATYLIIVRFFVYKSKGWHYFVFDLCYYVNLLTIIFLYITPWSRTLFIVLYCLTHGPLTWAIVTWRNSLVFHSLDKVTSVFIHIMPPLVLYTIRWTWTPIVARDEQFPALEGLDRLETGYTMMVSIIFYCFWQGLYYVFIMKQRREKVESGSRATSYAWLLNSPGASKSVIAKAANVFGPRYKLYVFMGLQLAYTCLSILPCALYFRYFWLNTVFLWGVFGVSVWNGASYYIEVFSRRYVAELDKLKETAQKVEMQAEATSKEAEEKLKTS